VDAASIQFIKEQRFPYIRIGSLGVDFVESGKKWQVLTEKTTFTGWRMKYWPEDQFTAAVIACSPDHTLSPEDLDASMASNPVVTPDLPSSRNMSTQCFKTAGELILAVIEQGWQGVKIIEGSDLMSWCIWAMCRVNGLRCEGYTPDEENDAMGRYERSEALLAAYNQNQPSFDRGVVLGAASGYDVEPFDFPDILDDEVD
jgi:hypothetical protein